MNSNTVKAALDILTDMGYEFHVSMYDRLRDLEEKWDNSRFLTAQILTDEYHRIYKDDLNHAVFVPRTIKEEK